MALLLAGALKKTARHRGCAHQHDALYRAAGMRFVMVCETRSSEARGQLGAPRAAGGAKMKRRRPVW